MTYSDFKTKYIGHGIDFDHFYGFQCMDLAEQYNKEVIGSTSKLGGNAKDVWTNYPFTLYTKITNTPTGVPKPGDIVIWGAMPGNPYGHIAIFDNGNTNTFTSLDQNWPVNSITHLQSHNYNYVLGWLHPIGTTTEKLISSSQILAILSGPGSDGDKLIAIRKLVS